MTLEPKPTIMDFERVFADFKIMMERQLMKRKLMMLRQDTKEIFGATENHNGHAASTVQGDAIPLEDRKSK